MNHLKSISSIQIERESDMKKNMQNESGTTLQKVCFVTKMMLNAIWYLVFKLHKSFKHNPKYCLVVMSRWGSFLSTIKKFIQVQLSTKVNVDLFISGVN